MARSVLSTSIFSHPLLGMYQNDLQILGDITEPVLDEKEWETTDNEWNNYQPQKNLKNAKTYPI